MGWVRLVVAVGTLLGPEGTTLWWGFLWGDCCMVTELHPVGVLVVAVVWWVRAFVENCTVDASIFVVKLLRADGGCLGTRSR